MRVLAACSLGGAGHLTPMLPFLSAVRRRGGEALVVGPPALADMVGRGGLAFRAGGEPPEKDIAPIREQLPVAALEQASVLGNRELFGRMATTAMLPGMHNACAEWKPDLILREPCEYASAVVGHGLGIPTAQVAISLAETEAGSITVAAPALEEHRAGLTDELLAAPYVTRFPASLDPSPFARTTRFSEPRPTAPPLDLPDWWDDGDNPLVYLTFGTVLGHMTIAERVFRTALDAVDGMNLRVLLTVGRHFDVAALTPIPANVHVEPWIDQEGVLAHADLVLCHGGSGTSFGALAAGVPLVFVPIFADQFANSKRITDRGAGVTVEEDATQIVRAMDLVLTTPSYRDSAQSVAAEMAGGPSVDDVLDRLLSDRGL